MLSPVKCLEAVTVGQLVHCYAVHLPPEVPVGYEGVEESHTHKAHFCICSGQPQVSGRWGI